MRTLHIAPGDSAGFSLKQAIAAAGSDDEVLRWPDDLSCGPIASGDASERAAFWGEVHEGGEEIEGLLSAFWNTVTGTDDRLVLWFGRHWACELAFSLAWASRVESRPYHVIDITGRRFPRVHRDGSRVLSAPYQGVGLLAPETLQSLLGTGQPASDSLRQEAGTRWRQLQQENAPFRIVTESGMVSAPADCFDELLLAQSTSKWQRMAQVIANTMGHNCEPYIQVGDMMLLTRVVALVEAGKLLADGDPWDMRECRVRLA